MLLNTRLNLRLRWLPLCNGPVNCVTYHFGGGVYTNRRIDSRLPKNIDLSFPLQLLFNRINNRMLIHSKSRNNGARANEGRAYRVSQLNPGSVVKPCAAVAIKQPPPPPPPPPLGAAVEPEETAPLGSQIIPLKGETVKPVTWADRIVFCLSPSTEAKL